MPFKDLSKTEQDVIYQCLEATVDGSFFPDWEFYTLFGLTRQEVEQVVIDWSIVNKDSSLAVIAINNSLNNLLGYPHKCEHEWYEFISVSRQELKAIYSKWKGIEQRYFDNMM
ncbi:MAG: hypothetical protein AAFR63_09435 [Cyanobacteria bacterium J06631_6]